MIHYYYRREMRIYLTAVIRRIKLRTRDKKRRKNTLGETCRFVCHAWLLSACQYCFHTHGVNGARYARFRKQKERTKIYADDFSEIEKKWVASTLKYKNFFFSTKDKLHFLSSERKHFICARNMRNFAKNFFHRDRIFLHENSSNR